MLQKIAFFILFLSSFCVSAQNEQLAMDYFEKGEFQKALTLFEEISTKQPSNYFFFQKVDIKTIVMAIIYLKNDKCRYN